jgi:uncharacterized membrane protein YjfL (UPF0719 family)
MKDLGYNSHDSILNLGTLGVLTFLYLRVLYYFGLKLYNRRFNNKQEERMKKLGESIFFGEFLFLAMEAYFEFLISGYLNISDPNNATGGKGVSYFLGIYVTIVALVIVPAVLVYVFSRP